MTTTVDFDQQVWPGIQALLDDYAGIRPDDDVVIAYTPDSREPAAWVFLALEERGLSPALVRMFPLRDPGFYTRLAAKVPERRQKPGRCICLLFELHTMSHNKTVKTVFSKYSPDQYQVIRAINSGDALFKTGLAIHPRELSALNASILERCRSAKNIRIETDAGTALTIQLDNSRFRWISNRGVGQPGKFMIIPAGEVATFPAKIEGVLVADFAINVNMFYDDDARLEQTPVTAFIKDGSLVSFSCANPIVTRFLDECFSRPNATRVGELGFGTNKAVRAPVRENSHLNERVPGVHIGFGQHNQTVQDAGYFCDIHVDLCARGGRVLFDDIDQHSSTLDLQHLTPSQSPHPILLTSEDVFSDDAEDDCCGILS